MTRKLLMIGAGIIAAVLLLAAPASAQYPPEVFSASFSNTSPRPGESVTVSGTCALADEVTVDLAGRGRLATIPVAQDGTYEGSFTIPADLAPGTYTVTVTCGSEVRSFTFTVGGGVTPPPGPPSSPGDLARTGTDLNGLVKLGGVFLVAGAAVVLGTTKRRTTA